LKAEKARLARFFKSIDKHRTALDFTVEEASGANWTFPAGGGPLTPAIPGTRFEPSS
jgi:hypothetical protein